MAPRGDENYAIRMVSTLVPVLRYRCPREGTRTNLTHLLQILFITSEYVISSIIPVPHRLKRSNRVHNGSRLMMHHYSFQKIGEKYMENCCIAAPLPIADGKSVTEHTENGHTHERKDDRYVEE